MELSKETIVEYIKHVVDFSRDAGDAIMKIYDQEDLGIESKKDESPLTMADLAANKILCDGLKKLNPDIPIISEENDDLDYTVRKDWDYCWIVDPLDGTKEFIKRNGEFTTNVALVRNGESIAGVIFAPVLNEMFWAVKGVGAYSEIDGQKTKLKVSTYSDSDKNLKLVCSRSHLNDATKAIVDRYSSPELVASGSSLKFMAIAKGDAHIYPRMAPTMEWDTCAAQAILEEAGGKVLIGESENPVQYNKEDLLNPHFIARGGKIG